MQPSVNFLGKITLVFEALSSSVVLESSVLSVRTRIYFQEKFKRLTVKVQVYAVFMADKETNCCELGNFHEKESVLVLMPG